MAGLIARLFGGKSRPPTPNPLPGLGGYSMPSGPAGQTGYPGSTSSTRTFGRGTPPRRIGLRVDVLGGANNKMGSTPETRQVSGRGDGPGDEHLNPRDTPSVTLPQTAIRQALQHNHSTEFFGGQPLRTVYGNNIVGGNPGEGAESAGGHAQRDTTTPWIDAQPIIGVGTPGANNVRNTIAERYKNPGGQSHSYKSSPNPGKGMVQEVVVQNRFVFPGDGNTTWSVEREMPYGGRGNGARGADLNGTRYYAVGQMDQFTNAGVGDYGLARQLGGKRPVNFTQPAPWTGQFYDTTASTGDSTTPGTNAQVPSNVYISPATGRASNGTGRG